MMDYALRTIDVTKLYASDSGTIRAVDDVSLEIRRGEFVALVGPSGSGKTTLLAMLAGLLRPTDGAILIDGHDLTRMSDAERTAFRRENIGFTFQSNNLVPYLTAQENVELMLRLNGRVDRSGRQKAAELLDRLAWANA
jgi:putative ABC transport system ATP-binding protein